MQVNGITTYIKLKIEEYVNEDIFTKDELDIINNVKKFFEKYTSSDIVTFSHEEKAFIETDFFKNISYEYAFDLNEMNND